MLAATVATVFSVKTCTNLAAVRHQSLFLLSFDFDVRSDYVDFDLQTGIFSVKTAVILLFNLLGLIQIVTKDFPTHHIELRVDGATKVITFTNLISETNMGYQQVVIISTWIWLKVGQN